MLQVIVVLQNNMKISKIYMKVIRNKGLIVIGMPSNQFGGQEPGSESEIKKFL